MSRAPKRTPRERLLRDWREALVGWTPSDRAAWLRTFQRDLRAHERDLAERAADAAEELGGWTTSERLRAHVRAAILGKPAAGTKKGGRR